ncbi:unnamed protein product, partial [Tilletia laevis]
MGTRSSVKPPTLVEVGGEPQPKTNRKKKESSSKAPPPQIKKPEAIPVADSDSDSDNDSLSSVPGSDSASALLDKEASGVGGIEGLFTGSRFTVETSSTVNPTAGAKPTKERNEKGKETAKSASTLQPAKKPTGSSAQIPMPIPGTLKPRKNAVGGSQVGSAMEEMVKSEEKRAEATDRQRQQERAQDERNLAISQNIERARLEMEREKAERDRGLEERKLSAVE